MRQILGSLFTLLVLGVIIWSQWGDEIGNFFSGTESPTAHTTESAPVKNPDARIIVDTSENEQSSESFIIELTMSIHTLINNERTQRGLPPLVLDSLLTSLAVEHSVEMARYNYFSHERMPGTRDFDWGMQPGTGRGENICYVPERKYVPGPLLSTEKVAEWSVSGWMQSPGHRENILNSSFSKSGIGISYGDGYFYITQIFEEGM